MIALIKLDKSHYRISEPDTFFSKGSKLYKRLGVDEVFVEDLLFKVWQDEKLPEDEIDIALDDMAEFDHSVAMFTSEGKFAYSLTKEEYEGSNEKV